MDVFSNLPEQHLNQFNFQKSKILLLDSNYSVETLAYVLAHSSEIEHVIYEPISNEKSKRILHSDLLSRLTILKPNLI
jgi:hypothetical protein